MNEEVKIQLKGIKKETLLLIGIVVSILIGVILYFQLKKMEADLAELKKMNEKLDSLAKGLADQKENQDLRFSKIQNSLNELSREQSLQGTQEKVDVNKLSQQLGGKLLDKVNEQMKGLIEEQVKQEVKNRAPASSYKKNPFVKKGSKNNPYAGTFSRNNPYASSKKTNPFYSPKVIKVRTVKSKVDKKTSEPVKSDYGDYTP